MSGQFQVIAPDVVLGQDVRIFHFVNLYGCTIGDAVRSAPLSKFRRASPSAKMSRYPATALFVRA